MPIRGDLRGTPRYNLEGREWVNKLLEDTGAGSRERVCAACYIIMRRCEQCVYVQQQRAAI